MPKDRLLELKTNHIEIRSNLGNGHFSGNSVNQANGKSQKKGSKKMRTAEKSMDDIFKEIQQVRVWLEAVEEETKLVRRLNSAILHSARSEPETKDKLMNAMIKIKTHSLRVKSSLKSLERQKEEKTAAVEVRMISVQHAALTKRFQTALIDYQSALAQHRDQTEQLIQTQLRIVIHRVMKKPHVLAGLSQHQSADELETLLNTENMPQVFVENYVQETEAMRLSLQDARLRHKEMLDLEKSISELHELFTDLATMVHMQGEKVNTIEYNVAQGTTQVICGNQEMAQAYTKKKSARRKKMWCFVLLISIVGLILVFTALSSVVSSFFTF